jgi:hypothetical protein
MVNILLYLGVNMKEKINKKQNHRKMLNAYFISVLIFATTIPGFSKEITTDVISKEGNDYWIDTNQDGDADSVFTLYIDNTLLSKYIKVGGKIIIEDEGVYGYQSGVPTYSNDRLIAIIIPDGKIFRIVDLVPEGREIYTYAFGRPKRFSH